MLETEQSLKRLPVLLASFFSFLLTFVTFLGWFTFISLSHPVPLKQSTRVVTFEITPGNGYQQFKTMMRTELEPSPFHLKALDFYARLRRYPSNIKPGEYELDCHDSWLMLLDKVAHAKVVQHPFTVVEGWTHHKTQQAASAVPWWRDSFTQIDAQRPLKPDTYFLTRGESFEAFLARAEAAHTERMKAYQSKFALPTPLNTWDEVLVMASIVEKETGLMFEKPLVAQVYLNRLKQGMRLQADPTVVFALGERFQYPLTKADLKTPSPFNTYLHHGLPPSPICYPSQSSIQAVLSGAKTSALYFVSMPDGQHVFSDTLNAHQQAIAQRDKLKSAQS